MCGWKGSDQMTIGRKIKVDVKKQVNTRRKQEN